MSISRRTSVRLTSGTSPSVPPPFFSPPSSLISAFEEEYLSVTLQRHSPDFLPMAFFKDPCIDIELLPSLKRRGILLPAPPLLHKDLSQIPVVSLSYLFFYVIRSSFLLLPIRGASSVFRNDPSIFFFSLFPVVSRVGRFFRGHIHVIFYFFGSLTFSPPPFF